MSRANRAKTSFVCQECGHREARWVGRCPSCQRWNSLVEEAPEPVRSPRRVAPAAVEATALDAVEVGEDDGRVASGIAELDRVLGGGLVRGATVLLGGDPGVGKSTLALQLGAAVAGRAGPALYVAGEEAPAQVRVRADRLGVNAREVFVLPATDTPSIAGAFAHHRPAVAVVDSVQTIYTPRIESAPGSVAQLREAAAELITAARERDVALLLIGHVTKEGFLAGPRVLEHMVDTVLYFEGDKNAVFRILRAVKNRYGPVGEIGVFEMVATGLREVENPSAAFAGADRIAAPGSVVAACMEGSRPLLVEVQALVAPSNPGSARRTSLGIDHARVAMLAAVMERRLGVTMINQDIFVNTVGGVRVDDPGVDLAVVGALASSYLDRALPSDAAIIGEVALTGEVRATSQARARVREAARLGFRRILLPAANLAQADPPPTVEAMPVRTVEEAWEILRGLGAVRTAPDKGKR